MVESTFGENHGIVVDPFRCVTPLLTTVVPEVTARLVANDTVREILPDTKREVDLQQQSEKNVTYHNISFVLQQNQT